MKRLLISTVSILSVLCMSSCSSKVVATDYSKEENWLIQRYNSANQYDLVFLIGTSVNEATYESGAGDICDQMRTSGLENYQTSGSQLSFVKSNAKNVYVGNVFVPLYRQMALFHISNYTSHEYLPNAIREYEPGVDLKASLDYYFNYINKDAKRPFVLAGHSQGSAALQFLLEDYFIKGGHKEYLKQMIAMYSTGYGISKKWYNTLDRKLDGEDVVSLATGAKDTHCILCWNTEGEGANGECSLLSDEKNDTYVINPLNWKTDNTYASRDENLGVLISNPNYDENNIYSPKYIISQEEDDKFDGYLNLERGTVVCSEPNSGTYVNIPPYGEIWGGKSLHCSDGAGFYVNMQRNLGDRLDVWFGK